MTLALSSLPVTTTTTTPNPSSFRSPYQSHKSKLSIIARPSPDRRPDTAACTSDIASPQWQPSQAVLACVVDGKEGRGRVMGVGKAKLGDAEKGLSSLYVQNERLVADGSTSRPIQKGGSSKNQGWSARVFNGAMNLKGFVTSFALLPQKRQRSDDAVPNLSVSTSPNTSHFTSTSSPLTHLSSSSSSGAAGSSETSGTSVSTVGTTSIRSRPSSMELPPPTYEETTASIITTQSHQPPDEDWVDNLPTDLQSFKNRNLPSRSSGPSPRHTHKYRRVGTRGKWSKLSTSSSASFTIEDTFYTSVSNGSDSLRSYPQPSSHRMQQPHAQYSKHLQQQSPLLHPLPIPHELVDEDIGHGHAVGDAENVSMRLDAMTTRLQDLIFDGQRALASASPVLSSVDGWQDEEDG